MRVMTVHNLYRRPGGEEVVFEAETSLLESKGHCVRREIFDSASIVDERSLLETSRLAASTIWSRAAADRIRNAIREFGPDVVHFHNTFPLVSPAAIRACQEEAVPVVQTLHSYRILCAQVFCLRDGRVCEDCFGRHFSWPGIWHACYRSSRAMSSVVSTMQLAYHRVAVRDRGVDLFVALSESSRQTFIRGGLPPERIAVKPNFVARDLGAGDHSGGFALFAGRLSPEKGLATLLEAWTKVGDGACLKIVGDGPMAGQVAEAATRSPAIEFVGRLALDDTLRLMGEASLLVFPSECNETFGLTIIEAYSRGTPVLASDLGTPRDLVDPGRTGVTFEAGNAQELSEKIVWLFDQPRLLEEMGRTARRRYEAEYTPERNYQQLMDVYRHAIERHR
jgi:glycosyltransferase involved in cell wall biosynthesis